MSLFSMSSGRRPYRNPNHGNSHYQRKGLFGKLGGLISSFSGSGRYGHQGGYPSEPLYRPDTSQSSMFCSSCGSKVPEGSKFCLECGAKMNTDSICSACGNPIPSGAKFCPSCGTQKR